MHVHCESNNKLDKKYVAFEHLRHFEWTVFYIINILLYAKNCRKIADNSIVIHVLISYEVLAEYEPHQANLCPSIPSWQILTAHAQPFTGAKDLAFCLKVPLDSLLVWASSGGSGETARMRRLAWTFAARIGDKYQIRLTRPVYKSTSVRKTSVRNEPGHEKICFSHMRTTKMQISLRICA